MEESTSDKRYCNNCGRHVSTITQILYSGPHYAKETCTDCGKFVAFTKRPENEGKRPPNKFSPSDLGIDYCQMCLRPFDRLGSRGVLSSHHVIEIGSNGIDEPKNIWILCTSCHRLVHHQRTYLNLHLRGMYTINELRIDMDKYGVPIKTREIMERIFEQQEVKNA